MSTAPAVPPLTELVMTPGARSGLAEATATCLSAREGWAPVGPQLLARLQASAQRLWPTDPLWGISESSWPKAFLLAESENAAADWCVALAVAIQRLARDPVGRGRVHVRGDQVVLAIPWQRKAVFEWALKFAVRYLDAWLRGESLPPAEFAELHSRFKEWLPAAQEAGQAPNTLRFAVGAREMDIPALARVDFLQLGWGVRQRRMDSSFTGSTSTIAARLARSKPATSRILREGGVPVPRMVVVRSMEQALEHAVRMGWPVVIKPADQDQGVAVAPHIETEEQLRSAFEAAIKFSPQGVLLEKHVFGADHRLLVVGGKLMSAARRDPATVTGDGSSKLSALIDQLNADPRRGVAKRNLLRTVEVDTEALRCLEVQGLGIDSIPEKGREVLLRRTPNISTGGTAVDVTDSVHADNRLVAERAARLVGLDIAGVDFLCPDISRSWREVGGAVCEVNSQPGLRPHWLGDPDRDINAEIVKWMFDGQPSRIPTAAVVGRAGLCGVAHAVHRIWRTVHGDCGVSSGEGVWLGSELLVEASEPGLLSARVLLGDPVAGAAVMALPRRQLASEGHPCDRYDVVALFEDEGVEAAPASRTELLADAAQRCGRAVVMDHPVHRLGLDVPSSAQRVIVARPEDLESLTRDIAGGAAVVLIEWGERPAIVAVRAAGREPICHLDEIPATRDGRSRPAAQVIARACAVALASGVSAATIRGALSGMGLADLQSPMAAQLKPALACQWLASTGHSATSLIDLRSTMEAWRHGRRFVLYEPPRSRNPSVQNQLLPLLGVADRLVLTLTRGRGADPQALRHVADWCIAQGFPASAIQVGEDAAAALAALAAEVLPDDLAVLVGPLASLRAAGAGGLH